MTSFRELLQDPLRLIQGGAMFMGPFFWALALLGLLIILIPIVFNNIALMRGMNAIDENRRPFPGGLIWLDLIPIAGSIWFLIYVMILGSSLKKECSIKGVEGDGTWGLSIALLATSCGIFISGFIPLMGMFIGGFGAIALLVLWIIHWVMVYGFTKKLTSATGAGSTEFS